MSIIIVQLNRTSHFATIQYGSPVRHQLIMETENETKSWLSKRRSYSYSLHYSFYPDTPAIELVTAV